MNQEMFRNIPKMDVLLELPQAVALEKEYSHTYLKESIQQYLEMLRRKIANGELDAVPGSMEIIEAVAKKMETDTQYTLKPVINATGVVLHTNLGRAPLGREITKRLQDVAQGYCNLEYDIKEGKRGSRYVHVEKLLCRLTGAQAALVVNNNAAAVFLMLNTLAKGESTVISRGELVEIGGSFRIPEIMEQAGTQLIEVGTTNKTHASDYIKAIEEQEAKVLLKVHSSNFEITGFSESVEIEELSQIAKAHGKMLLYDLGSAFMMQPERLGLHAGSLVQKAIKDGADVVCFSGDKLLGSAQTGIILGKKEYIERMKKNHLTRMLRVDKLTLSVLEQTLLYYQDEREAISHIPVMKMLEASQETLKERAGKLAQELKQADETLNAQVVSCKDEPGGGSLPNVYLDGYAVVISKEGWKVEDLEKQLRGYKIPIIARIYKDRLLLSVRTLQEKDDKVIKEALKAIEA
ncbi:L-seryl-tRNA(Sec) selenium transferase [Eubacterium oxidoreducens]|uniref:L-seryl-tRNA(Sec) selenium transferase n=1 Tax=Eubacterium oxidoreducens TaxID=1732 RepID=A0A1G6CAN1_EUBOX|nr:L-seryl-tRNA(Sec) selenium transferase [Eubacterium oxidoreducens]SDB29968.1 L-seryl-tRNA(Sec) selenium transferase [Eubacterium oxidoreducens]